MSACQFRGCNLPAMWTAGDSAMCELHFEGYRRTMTQRVAGIDPPEGASDFWQPSIMEMVRQGDNEIRRQERASQPPVVPQSDAPTLERERRWTPAQRAQAAVLRAALAGPPA